MSILVILLRVAVCKGDLGDRSRKIQICLVAIRKGTVLNRRRQVGALLYVVGDRVSRVLKKVGVLWKPHAEQFRNDYGTGVIRAPIDRCQRVENAVRVKVASYVVSKALCIAQAGEWLSAFIDNGDIRIRRVDK